MSQQTPSCLSVALADRFAIVKVTGRAAFNKSISLKTLVKELNDRGYAEFLLDLTDCGTMDSTFVGVLVGIAASFPQRQQTATKISLQLFHPSQRVSDLLENLGVSHLFPVYEKPYPTAGTVESPAPEQSTPSKEEISKTCLEAHENLMKANPENILRFKDVVQFLAEDLKKLDP